MSDEWYTPNWIFDGLGLTFDADVASPGKNISLCPASRHYTIINNGLEQDWEGLVWMNLTITVLR